jgi:sodium/bile acid cotransporter 7
MAMNFRIHKATIGLMFLCSFLALPAWASELSDLDKKRAVYEQYARYQEKFPDVAAIVPQKAMARSAGGKKIIFIDTRRPEEMEVSTLPDAISKEQYLASPGKYEDHLKIAYCTIGYRSGIFSEKMGARGDKVVNLTGGILAWTLEGGRVFRNNLPVKQVHVFAERWNYAPDDYEAETFSLFEQLF